MTPTSLEWVQLTVEPSVQSISLGSIPVHVTLSKLMAPLPGVVVVMVASKSASFVLLLQ